MRSLPSSFCWTKMGAESGQSLESIIQRKELERQSSDGYFCWGIGNSLGDSLITAISDSKKDSLRIVFTQMKSAAKKIDTTPSAISLWLDYSSPTGEIHELPMTSLVVSRAHTPKGFTKRHHYALLCYSRSPLNHQNETKLAVVAGGARNYQTGKAIGFSQVTSVVKYESNSETAVEANSQAYNVLFDAELFGIGIRKFSVYMKGKICGI